MDEEKKDDGKCTCNPELDYGHCECGPGCVCGCEEKEKNRGWERGIRSKINKNTVVLTVFLFLIDQYWQARFQISAHLSGPDTATLQCPSKKLLLDSGVQSHSLREARGAYPSLVLAQLLSYSPPSFWIYRTPNLPDDSWSRHEALLLLFGWEHFIVV